MPFVQDSVDVLVERILAAQDALGRRILVENLSTYVSFEDSEMSEWAFISEIVKRADCYLLLDINNVYVSCCNHRWDPHEFLRGIPHDRVRQIHLAGHTDHGHVKIDTHGDFVCQPVWDLFRWYTERYGAPSPMIEWDMNIPPWEQLAGELRKVAAIVDDVGERRCA
jgi:uncharacterized protein (UPF0276 family)